MKKLKKIINRFRGLRWKYLLYGSYVYADANSRLCIGSNVKIICSKIHLTGKSEVEILNGVHIKNVTIICSRSSLKIGELSVITNGSMPTRSRIILTNGSKVVFGTHNRLKMQRVWVRFGGQVRLGNYINLNEYSEIRCDESIIVGDYVEISYNVKIWDTNTHEFEQIDQRRERWCKLYLKRDVSEKPKTCPISIGSDSWIGERVAILKGTTIGERCVVGFGTIISNKSIPDSTTVLNCIDLKLIPNNL